MRPIHTPHATQWRVGDFVIHDSDVKRADLLMVVIGCSRQGIYRRDTKISEHVHRCHLTHAPTTDGNRHAGSQAYDG